VLVRLGKVWAGAGAPEHNPPLCRPPLGYVNGHVSAFFKTERQFTGRKPVLLRGAGGKADHQAFNPKPAGSVLDLLRSGEQGIVCGYSNERQGERHKH